MSQALVERTGHRTTSALAMCDIRLLEFQGCWGIWILSMFTYCAYIMCNRSGTLYAGVTNNLQRRVAEHRQGLCSFTRHYRITKLVFYEVTKDVREAIAWEKQIKGWTRARKLELIRSRNPAFKDLAPELFGWRAAQFSVAEGSSRRR